jgi:uncharacterized protein YdaU (DUF1376 family)
MPKADHPPSFPFYVDDFIADSAVDAMTNQELGIYVRLLCKAWKEEPVGTLPVDDHLLARWAKETPAGWRKCKAGVFRAFKIVGGRLHQKRMMEVWQKVLENREAKSRAGKKGMAHRWQNDNTVITEPITKDNLSFPIPISTSISNTSPSQEGARDLDLGEENNRIRLLAQQIQKATGINCRDQKNHKLVAQVAILWDAGEFSADEMHTVFESFEKSKKKIDNKTGYLFKALSNRCEERRVDLNQLLDRTIVPLGLMMSSQSGASA